MLQVKNQLKELIRIQPDNESRQNCLRLDLNENIAGLPERFVQEVIGSINADFLCTYPKYNELKEKIAGRYSLKAEQICLGNGSDGIIKYFFDAFISAGDKVLLTSPTFAMYNVYCQMFDAVEVTVDYNEDLSFPMEEFQQQLTKDIKLAVIVNPNNPAGTVLSKDELSRLICTAMENDIFLMIDEAYFPYYAETAIQEVNNYPNVIVLQTFSKLCALATSRIGYAAADKDIIQNLEKVKPTYDVNGFGVIFAESLLDQPQIIDQMVEDFSSSKKYFYKRLKEENISFKESHANFVLIDVGSRAEDIKINLQNENVLVGGGFKQDFLKQYIRVTIADAKRMDEFLRKFIKIYKGLQNE